jgi:hypothetical protein
MNRCIALGLTAIISATLSAAAVQVLHAQTKPKAYIVTEVEVTDSAALAAYAERRIEEEHPCHAAYSSRPCA